MKVAVERKTTNFSCRRCGACCRIKDGIVRVSDDEVTRIAAFLGMKEGDFIATETELAPDRRSLVLKSRPDGSCIYLTSDNLCRINPVKPDKCRTFPFAWTNPNSSEVCPALSEAAGYDKDEFESLVPSDGFLHAEISAGKAYRREVVLGLSSDLKSGRRKIPNVEQLKAVLKQTYHVPNPDVNPIIGSLMCQKVVKIDKANGKVTVIRGI